jgi:hypothetical protein
MDGRVSAGAMKWSDDRITATQSGYLITGTVPGADDPRDIYKVAFKKLW